MLRPSLPAAAGEPGLINRWLDRGIYRVGEADWKPKLRENKQQNISQTIVKKLHTHATGTHPLLFLQEGHSAVTPLFSSLQQGSQKTKWSYEVWLVQPLGWKPTTDLDPNTDCSGSYEAYTLTL